MTLGQEMRWACSTMLASPHTGSFRPHVDTVYDIQSLLWLCQPWPMSNRYATGSMVLLLGQLVPENPKEHKTKIRSTLRVFKISQNTTD